MTEQHLSTDSLRYSETETPPLGTTLLLALTHIALIFDAVVFIPNVLGKVTGAPPDQIRFSCFVTILVSALCSLIQAVKVGRLGTGFILFMGSYSAYLACSIDAARTGGLALVGTMTILTVPTVLLFSYFFKYFRHIITPAVGGIVILLVGLSLVPVGLELWQGGSPGDPGFGSLNNYLVGAFTMGTLLFFMLFGNQTIRLWTPIIALGGGYALSFFLGTLDLHHTLASPWIGLPGTAWPGLTFDLNFSHLPLLAAFTMATLAGNIEGTGNIMLVQSVSRRDKKINYDKIRSGLYCDGLGKFLSGAGGGAPVSIYCDNIPLIEMTGVASRAVGIAGAILLGCLAFIPKAGAIILDMPSPVAGGMVIALAALIFHAGIGLIMESGLNNQTGLMMGISITVGMISEADPFFPDLIPDALAPMLGNGVAMGGLAAFILSILFRVMPRKKIAFAVPGEASALSQLMDKLHHRQGPLRLSQNERARLELACEEAFMHLISESTAPDNRVVFKIMRNEQGLFTEAVIGRSVSDTADINLPDNLMAAEPEDLQDLGIFLLGKMVRDIRHIQISGVTYLSFIV